MGEPDVIPDRLPARHPEVEVAVFPGAIVVFDPRNRMAHELVGAPAAVFDACCEQTEGRAAIDELVVGGLGTHAEVTEVVQSVLRDLAELGLLEGCDAPTPPPCIECDRESTGWRRRRGR